MKLNRTGLSYSPRSNSLLSKALVVLSTLSVFNVTAEAHAQSAFQNIVLSQSAELGLLTSGGGQSGQEPAGASMAVDSKGDLIMANTVARFSCMPQALRWQAHRHQPPS
jgi:hypothetical protein